MILHEFEKTRQACEEGLRGHLLLFSPEGCHDAASHRLPGSEAGWGFAPCALRTELHSRNHIASPESWLVSSRESCDSCGSHLLSLVWVAFFIVWGERTWELAALATCLFTVYISHQLSLKAARCIFTGRAGQAFTMAWPWLGCVLDTPQVFPASNYQALALPASPLHPRQCVWNVQIKEMRSQPWGIPTRRSR